MSRLASDLFKLLQARYGDRFLHQFSSGQQDADGADTGIQLALAEWGRYLMRYTEKEIIAAADAAMTTHKRFPPTLPEFRDLCDVEARRRPPPPRIEHQPAPLPPDWEELRANARKVAIQRQEERDLRNARRRVENALGEDDF